ncbi:MAG: error-prone DNA polymerase [Myxococcales bacterium]|nr:error-prone DNA polymerase [Myxococcales bacterium]
MPSSSKELYVELQIATAFSFLRGASQPGELVHMAGLLGYKRVAITDHNGLYGVVQAHRSGMANGVEVIPGAELTLSDGAGSSLILLPENIDGYAHLCRLITLGRCRGAKGEFNLWLQDVAAHAKGLQAIHIGHIDVDFVASVKDIFEDRLALGLNKNLTPNDHGYQDLVNSVSSKLNVRKVVTGGVLIHHPNRKPLQDILTCIRLGLTLDEAGRYLLPNHAARLRSPEVMRKIYQDEPEALAASKYIAELCRFRLGELKQEFVLEVLPEGETGDGYLRKLVEKGLFQRYGARAPGSVLQQVEHELALIQQLDYAGYFLTVWDIVRWARSQSILCQGRGSSANSIVCYLLGITSIDPVRMDLLFERFISMERNEPPDIDIDIDNSRREEVIQYVYSKYGRDRAAMVANVIRYRNRLAYREVAKVLGIGKEQTSRLIRNCSHWENSPMGEKELEESGLDSTDIRVQNLVRWSTELVGFPRHLGLHPGGFVITKQPLDEMVPIENATKSCRTVIEWDKRDIETLGLVKVDLLGLGILSVIQKSFAGILASEGLELDLSSLPSEDANVYNMICDADTIGTFQVESRAQMQILPRLKPRTFYDLVISIAIVRPGPIQGDMIHPYLRRREGLDVIEYPHPALEEILGKTHGIPLFQEQVMKMAIATAGFSPGEADQLRRAIGWQSEIEIKALRTRLVEGMLRYGLSRDYAEQVYRMIQGFGAYGFPESHAASFALISYASCYLKRYHPAAYLIGLLNSQPMGFYQPRTLVADAQRHGVEIRPVSVLRSSWDAKLELGSESYLRSWWESSSHPARVHTPWADLQAGRWRRGQVVQSAVRLGFRSIHGLAKDTAARIEVARGRGEFYSFSDLIRKTGIAKQQLLVLASAGAFRCFGLERRAAIWEVLATNFSKGLFAETLRESGSRPSEVRLPPMSKFEEIQADYSSFGMSLRCHPMELLRSGLDTAGVRSSRTIDEAHEGAEVEVAGLVITRQRPTTARGVIFVTLEDENGHMNLVIFRPVYERYKEVARDAMFLRARGILQRSDKVIHIVVRHMSSISLEAFVAVRSRDFR